MKTWQRAELAELSIEMTAGGRKNDRKETGSKHPQMNQEPISVEPIILPETPETNDDYITDATSGPTLVL